MSPTFLPLLSIFTFLTNPLSIVSRIIQIIHPSSLEEEEDISSVLLFSGNQHIDIKQFDIEITG